MPGPDQPPPLTPAEANDPKLQSMMAATPNTFQNDQAVAAQMQPASPGQGQGAFTVVDSRDTQEVLGPSVPSPVSRVDSGRETDRATLLADRDEVRSRADARDDVVDTRQHEQDHTRLAQREQIKTERDVQRFGRTTSAGAPVVGAGDASLIASETASISGLIETLAVNQAPTRLSAEQANGVNLPVGGRSGPAQNGVRGM